MPLDPLPETIPPCPFCSLNLQRDDKRNTGASHPVNPECVLSGWFIGAKNLTAWALRRPSAPDSPSGGLYMTVEGGRPTFNENGAGRLVSASELNLYIEWYEAQRASG